jgi:predicted amidophosphoribosyltransferase
VVEILEYLLDFIFPRKADLYKDLKGDNFNENNLENTIHNYLEGTVWISGIQWAKDLDCDKKYPIIHASLYKNVMMQKLIHRAKFGKEYCISKQIGSKIGKILLSTIESSVPKFYTKIVITYIPPDKKRLSQRGFHIPEIIAKYAFQEINKTKIANTFQIKFMEMLIKTKNTERQTQLNKEERKINIMGMFKISSETYNQQLYSCLEENVLIILIDDVTTTGSTMMEGLRVITQNNINNPTISAIGLCWLFAE